MGEKADMVEGDVGIDTNSILESVEYEECRLPQHRDIPLAECVGRCIYADHAIEAEPGLSIGFSAVSCVDVATWLPGHAIQAGRVREFNSL